MNNLIPYVGPPLIGAVIGYVTNDIAIKMLFRPLKERRLFGLRVPFTPGILPRQRHRLADNIGRMVERELITEDILRRRLAQDDFRRTVERSVADFTGPLLAEPLSGLSRHFPFLDGADLPRSVAALIVKFIHVPLFPQLVEGAVAALSATYAEKTLPETLGLDADQLEKRIQAIVGTALCGSAGALSTGAAELADTAYPRLSDALLALLEKPPVRAELEAQGRIFLGKALLKLNVFQRFFVSAAQYDRTLHERMPEIIDDLIAQIAALLSRAETRQQAVSLVRDATQGVLGGTDSAERLTALIGGLILPILDRPLSELIRSWTGTEAAAASRKLSNTLVAQARGLSVDSLAQKLHGLLDHRLDRSLAELLALDGEAKQKIDHFMADSLLAVADERMAAALKTLDVRTVVSERVDALDMLAVERIVLDVMSDQFRWINIFGALLGALIGAAQVGVWFFFG